LLKLLFKILTISNPRFAVVAFLMILTISATILAQVDISFTDTELTNALEHIAKEFDVTFVYSNDIAKRRVNLQLKNAELETVLRFLSQAANLDYLRIGNKVYVLFDQSWKSSKLTFREYVTRHRESQELAEMIKTFGVECFAYDDRVIILGTSDETGKHLLQTLERIDSQKDSYRMVIYVVSVSKALISTTGQLERNTLKELLKVLTKARMVRTTYGLVTFSEVGMQIEEKQNMASFQVNENLLIRFSASKFEIETDMEVTSYQIDSSKTHQFEFVAESKDDYHLIISYLDIPEELSTVRPEKFSVPASEKSSRECQQDNQTAFYVVFKIPGELSFSFSSDSTLVNLKLNTGATIHMLALKRVEYISRITSMMWVGLGYSSPPQEEVYIILAEKLSFGTFSLIPKLMFEVQKKQFSFVLLAQLGLEFLKTLYTTLYYSYEKEGSTYLGVELGLKYSWGTIGFVTLMDSHQNFGFGLALRW